jgi:2'-5' RNA ligase
MTDTTLRLFVAVELPAATRDALARTVDAMRAAGIDRGLRWVRPEGIHITLKFLGAVEVPRVAAIAAALSESARGVAPFALQPDRIGSFGGRRGLRVIWAGVGGETAALTGLAQRVEDALAPLGFDRERRPFAAHLTLARVREDASPAERERLYDALARLATPPVAPLRVERFCLMRSTLQRGGAVYDAVATFELAP